MCDSPRTGCAWRTTPYIYVARISNNRVIMACELYCCLLPQCEALRMCRSGFPIATQPQFMTNCSMRMPPGERRHKQSLPPFVTVLTWRRNMQIQMYWLWKWLESYNNCTFSTWKDKFLFNLLFWILTRFAHFMIMLGEELPCLPWRPVTDFLSFRFLNNFLSLKNRVALKLFTLMKYFYLSGLLSHLWIALKNRVCPEFTVLNIYSLNHSEFW